MFFCEQMFLIKTGNKHKCDSAIYILLNFSNLFQQECDIEYYSITITMKLFLLKD